MRANAILDLVRRLLKHEAQEAVESQDLEALTGAAERALDKLRAHLSLRIGPEGFGTLLARALTLTTSQFPHLSAVRIGADGSLVGLGGSPGQREAEDGQTQADGVEGAVALLAHLLGLLTTFIGEDLTQRMLSTVWPALALNEITGGGSERS